MVMVNSFGFADFDVGCWYIPKEKFDVFNEITLENGAYVSKIVGHGDNLIVYVSYTE